LEFEFDKAWGRAASSGAGPEHDHARHDPGITVEYTAWRRAGDLRLPRRLTIVHGKEVWRYRFTGIEIDTLGAKAFDPRAASSRWGPDRG
jgi:hypothetical protein